MDTSAHTFTSYPKGRILLHSCTEGLDVTRTTCNPCSFAQGPPWQPDYLSVSNPARVTLLSFITCLITSLWLALTPVKATVWDAAQRCQTPHELQCTHSSIAAPQPWPAAPLCLFLFAASPGLACTLRSWQTALTNINATFHWGGVKKKKKKSSAALSAGLHEKKWCKVVSGSTVQFLWQAS